MEVLEVHFYQINYVDIDREFCNIWENHLYQILVQS